MEVFVLAYAALIGACVGSFLNVCVYRWPEDLSVISPPSACPSCGTRIKWYDNVPVLGWLWLRGRCRACGARISIQYPLVELLTAGLWVMAFWRFGLSWQALSTALFFTLLLGIALSDARTYIIPDQFTVGGLVLGLALSFAPGGIGWKSAFLGAALGYALLWFVGVAGEWAFKKEA
ncbi:MAG TPA: prepilin peptidase, partial [Longimicrobium sp.]|nr:prepilin peptidase [Longimicrobium sp.]